MMTYMHEHLRLDLSREKGDEDCLLDSFDLIAGELGELSQRGLKRIVDMSCRGMGRDYNYLDRMERQTGIELVVSTGFYKEPFLPPEAIEKNVQELSEIFIRDIEEGAEGSGRRAALIGEIGTSLSLMTPMEEKVFRAAALAHERTGVPISTHTTLGTLGVEQARLLTTLGVEPSRIIIGHLDLANNLNAILRVLDMGVYVEFDTIGKTKYLPEETRVEFIRACCLRGYENQLLLSMDITRKSHLRANGGPGYAYLPDSFLPALKEAGVSQRAIERMLTGNPAEVLGGRLK
ncbi:MAG: phosphotriesterase-related protein [Spirochaetales bacterium]|jgi:phosphotriesterase-related protein|nr:phosphotriesterase-related protein [Spirochaetales bacterium]